MTVISDIADYLAFDPDGLGMDPDETGKPALISAVYSKWPEATPEIVGQACRLGADRARAAAASCFSEADALGALKTAVHDRRRAGLSVITGGREE